MEPAGTPALPGRPAVITPDPACTKQAVAVAVVAAIEFHNFITSGVAPGGPNGAHYRLGAGVHHAHHLHPGHHPADHPGHLHLNLRGCPIAEAPGGGFRHRLSDFPPVMAQNHGPPGAYIVDIAVSVGVGQVGPVGFCNEPGAAANCGKGPDRAVHPTGDIPLRLFKKLLQSVSISPASLRPKNGPVPGQNRSDTRCFPPGRPRRPFRR